MATIKYYPVSQSNTTFGNPRQKTWGVFHNVDGWKLELETNSFPEAQDCAKDIITNGGLYGGVNHVMVCEIVPIDIVMAPTV